MRVCSLRKKRWSVHRWIIIELVILVISLGVFFYVLQRYWAHREGSFVPDYPKVTLTEDSDYETIFLQTGLGQPAVEKLLEEGDFQAVLEAQEAFFHPQEVECEPLLGWFTREDRVKNTEEMRNGTRDAGTDTLLTKRRLVELQPGDIIVTLSTHSLGWNHGHAALVIDEDTTLECMVLGTDSTFGGVDGWTEYSNYAVLRVKGTTPEQRQGVADYAESTLVGVPYSLLAGFIGDKAPDTGAWHFGLQCSYLVWYAWEHFGYDLDSDGGRLVSTHDLLCSDKVEIVQIYGMDPQQFAE